MDYEWFEPNTVWLTRPVWQKVKDLKCFGCFVIFCIAIPSLREKTVKSWRLNIYITREKRILTFAGTAGETLARWSQSEQAFSQKLEIIFIPRVSYLGEEPVRDDTGNDSSSLSPRGVIQSKDLDFSYYYLDCGVI